MPREFTRSDRVSAQIQRELSELLRLNARDPELGMVTLSAVEVTRDMSLAKAYVSFLGAGLDTKKCVARLNEAVPLYRHELGKRIRLRVMPELRFVFDESLLRGLRIQSLLSGLDEAAEKLDQEKSRT
jgi:ribosome-binding factor A